MSVEGTIENLRDQLLAAERNLDDRLDQILDQLDDLVPLCDRCGILAATGRHFRGDESWCATCFATAPGERSAR